MKLLPSRQVETHIAAVQSAESQRITAIRSHLTREERQLNDWNDAIEAKKQEAMQDFEEKVILCNQELKALRDEVVLLEEKRTILLKPLDDTPEMITEKLAVTENLLDYLKHRKKELADEKKHLTVSQIEAERQLSLLLNRENTLDRRELDIAKRETSLKQESAELSESVADFTDTANKKGIELMLFESRLSKKEVELAEREKLVAQANEKIAMDRKRIESQQQSLIAALAEIKNKT